MKKIKFRAWDKKYKEMFNVVMIAFPIGREIILSGKGGSIGADDCEIMQFIGLHDKNGKEIYEGDILKHNGEIRKVVYVAPSFELQLLNEPAYAWDDWTEFGKVIGNIYKNPNLLTNNQNEKN